MDEITMVNLLNKISEKNPTIQWNLSCKYHDGISLSIMQIRFTQKSSLDPSQLITFNMESGEVLNGKYSGAGRFEPGVQLIDALLDILGYEQSKQRAKAH